MRIFAIANLPIILAIAPLLMQDQQLINRLQAQDRAAIGTLYEAYGGALFGVVLRIVQQRELAEQVLQDTFVKAWKNGASYDTTKGRLFTWLLNIARNTAIDATRTAHYQKSRKTDSLDSLVHSPGGQSLNPDQIGVRELVNRLDEKYKTLIDMVYFRGYTQEEVAEETGIPLGTVKTRLRYAINELRGIFGENGLSSLILMWFWA
ncbi:MAG: RNA polymerase sigma factor [Saprospiraceae bacterium]|nr:RNA polymerase sigma factor [Saprospiraceae bacterium]